jgi:hypothetical protein
MNGHSLDVEHKLEIEIEIHTDFGIIIMDTYRDISHRVKRLKQSQDDDRKNREDIFQKRKAALKDKEEEKEEEQLLNKEGQDKESAFAEDGQNVM